MSDITPEILKVVAEGMPDGRPVEIDEEGVWYMNYPPTTGEGYGVKVHAVEFNPLTNAEQCMEIMEKLKISPEFVEECGCSGWFAKVKNGRVSEGKTINEAVVLAAYEYFNNINE